MAVRAAAAGSCRARRCFSAALVLRPDWENVVAPVIDYALTRTDVDQDRIALIG